MQGMCWYKLHPIVRAYLLSILVWCTLSLLTGWQYRIFDEGLNIRSSFLDMVLLAESRGFAFALLTPPIFYLVRRYTAGIGHPLRHAWIYPICLAPFMLLYACIRWTVLPPWDAGLQTYVSRAAHGPLELIQSGFADQITMYIAILAAAHAYVYFEKVRKQDIERYEYEQALATSQLRALKMQLHPHFLFNTLHGISTLIESDGERAKTMIVKLSSLLRVALQHSGSDLVPLQKELAFVQEYLDIEKMRLGPRLNITNSIGAETHNLMVPQLILQPLVENAVRHGIASSREAGWIEICSRKSDTGLELQVRNSVGEGRPNGNGVGLQNTEARLRNLYFGEAIFSFRVMENHIAVATLQLPVLRMNRLPPKPSASRQLSA